MGRLNVTKTFLPPLEEYEKYVKQIWESGYLTNQGPLLQEFEAKAKEYLGVDNFHFLGNGTIALQVALHSLGIVEGEVITTPFSYVATTSSILWERCDPVFVDIEPNTFCIDADKIEASITERTKAILAVHVFGNPCDIEKIEAIALKHNLKVIYDAAHAFGVTYKGKSLLDYGDISMCSFHSTKVFHTIEGGSIVARDEGVSDVVELTKRFGHNGDQHYTLGINAKANEFQAAMGLCNLKYVDGIIEARKASVELYDSKLTSFKKVTTPTDVKSNYAYYPILLDSETQLLEVVARLNEEDIYPRRYFYPSLNTLPYLKTHQDCPVSEDISLRILCLPLSADLAASAVEKICGIVEMIRAK